MTLLGLYTIPMRLESIPAISSPPWTPAPITPIIPKSREEAKQIAKDVPDSTALHVYTDGSGIDGLAGAAAVLFNGRIEIASMRVCLGPLTEHTVHEGEAVAAVLGLHMIQKHIRQPPGAKFRGAVNIGIDNHAILKAKYTGRPHSGYHILKSIPAMIRSIRDSMAEPHRMTMMWTPGHEDILGNERADEEAKAAAQGTKELSPPAQLPRCLRYKGGYPPVNKSAARQDFRKQQKREWGQECAAQHRFRRLHAIDASLPSNRFLKLTKSCSRHETSILTQMRSSRIPLNRHLHQMGKAERPTCPHCPTQEETVRHYLMECGHYSRERATLRRTLRRGSDRLSCLLASKAGIEATLKFIKTTRRFDEA